MPCHCQRSILARISCLMSGRNLIASGSKYGRLRRRDGTTTVEKALSRALNTAIGLPVSLLSLRRHPCFVSTVVALIVRR